MRITSCALTLLLMAVPVAACADTAASGTTPAKMQAASSVPAGKTARAQPQAPLTPRWIAPTVTISGLTVWTYRPGHFQGQ